MQSSAFCFIYFFLSSPKETLRKPVGLKGTRGVEKVGIFVPSTLPRTNVDRAAWTIVVHRQECTHAVRQTRAQTTSANTNFFSSPKIFFYFCLKKRSFFFSDGCYQFSLLRGKKFLGIRNLSKQFQWVENEISGFLDSESTIFQN